MNEGQRTKSCVSFGRAPFFSSYEDYLVLDSSVRDVRWIAKCPAPIRERLTCFHIAVLVTQIALVWKLVWLFVINSRWGWWIRQRAILSRFWARQIGGWNSRDKEVIEECNICRDVASDIGIDFCNHRYCFNSIRHDFSFLPWLLDSKLNLHQMLN